VRFVIGYHGQAAGPNDNDATTDWIKRLFFMSVKTVIGQMCAQSGRSLLNLGGMTQDLAGRMIQSAPNLADIGVKILQIADFNINFSAEDEKLLREANKKRAEARRNIGIAQDTAAANQFGLDQKFNQDSRYVQQLAGNYGNYAAAQAMMGAGEGMAKGGANVGVAGLGAQMAMGVGMANMMSPHAMMQQGAMPQFAVGAPQAAQAAPGAAPAAPGGAASIEDRLAKLKGLKDKGLISDDDFAKRRDAILAEI
jgi:hypothetical protein